MRFLLVLILFVFFGYSIGLVIMNNAEMPVNLLFTEIPASNFGLLLIIAILLGVAMGIILSLILFRVLQNKWEIRGLKKEVKSLRGKLDDANQEIEHQKKLRVEPPVSELKNDPIVESVVEVSEQVNNN